MSYYDIPVGALTDPLSSEHVPSHQAIADALNDLGAKVAASPGIRAFPFAFDTAGLDTGIEIFTPKIGDLLIDAWFEVDTAWDGTTLSSGGLAEACADVGQYDIYGNGWFGWFGGPIDLSVADVTMGQNAGEILQGTAPNNPGCGLNPLSARVAGANYRMVPAKFTSVSPVILMANRFAQVGNYPIGATHGAAILFVETATPQ
jgi:hypothetical protein